LSPKVSVVIPCHDQGRRLDEAVDSVFAQTLEDFEILVIDDGSTDPATVRLLGNYRWPKTRVLATDHAGASAARNLGLRETGGSLVCFLDPMERLERGFLERGAALLAEDAAIAFVNALARAADDPAGSSGSIRPVALARREPIVSVGGFDEGSPDGDHWGLWVRLLENGFAGALAALVVTHAAPAEVASCETGRIPLPRAVRRARPAVSADDRYRLDLESALWNARRDLEDLRNSRSWRATGPARAMHRWLVRLKGGS
jgi:glycosyltransferase involved in cell wall biosynthesis